MPNDDRAVDDRRLETVRGPDIVEAGRQADETRRATREYRVAAESVRNEAEEHRRLAEAAKDEHDQHREALEQIGNDREDLRHPAATTRLAAEPARTAAESAGDTEVPTVRDTDTVAPILEHESVVDEMPPDREWRALREPD